MATTDETADAVAKAKLALEAAEAEHAAALEGNEANKSPEQIIMDLLETLVMRLGNRPELRALMRRLQHAVDRHAQPAPDQGEAPTA